MFVFTVSWSNHFIPCQNYNHVTETSFFNHHSIIVFWTCFFFLSSLWICTKLTPSKQTRILWTLPPKAKSGIWTSCTTPNPPPPRPPHIRSWEMALDGHGYLGNATSYLKSSMDASIKLLISDWILYVVLESYIHLKQHLRKPSSFASGSCTRQ